MYITLYEVALFQYFPAGETLGSTVTTFYTTNPEWVDPDNLFGPSAIWDAPVQGPTVYWTYIINGGLYGIVPEDDIPSDLPFFGGGIDEWFDDHSTVLFTANTDIVAFSTLTSDQRKAVDEGAELYKALSGDDIVSLPSTAVISGTSKSWDFGRWFLGGAGDDKVTGGKQNDRIDGGSDVDTLLGGAGNDWIKGNTGDDVLDGGTRTQTGTYDDLDVVLLNGAPSDYTFFDNLAGNVTTAEHKITGEVDQIKNFEKMRFVDPTANNVVSFSNVYSELARLSVDAYGDSPISQSGWRPVHANELGLGIESDPGESKPWTMLNGIFQGAGASDADAIPGASVAHVYSGEYLGKSVLAIAFRGTDMDRGIAEALKDMAGWGPAGMSDYYNSYGVLLDALKSYVNDNSVAQVYVTRHSLGGAMAQLFMNEVRGDSRYVGATFGSPGTELALTNDRLVNFQHTEDAVRLAVQTVGHPLFGYKDAGEKVLIPINDVKNEDDRYSVDPEHLRSTYVESLENLSLMGADLPEFMRPDLLHVPGRETHVYAGDNKDNNFGGDRGTLLGAPYADEYLYGLAGKDTIRGYLGDDVIYGGRGNDTLIGCFPTDTAVVGRDDDILHGGQDNDTLYGGRGRDILIGGTDADVFQFKSARDSISLRPDLIRDFSRQQLDKIDLSAIDANRNVELKQSFLFVGFAEFSGLAGELRADAGIVEADLDGNKTADFSVKLVNGATLLLGDFIL